MALVFKIFGAMLALLMAIRAVQSGSKTDILLSMSLVTGAVMLFFAPPLVATLWITLTAIGYLVSQILTHARPISRVLPVVLILCALASYFAQAPLVW